MGLGAGALLLVEMCEVCLGKVSLSLQDWAEDFITPVLNPKGLHLSDLSPSSGLVSIKVLG